jgi:hypothetical protein
MPGEFTCLDKDEWKELPDRHVHKSGNVYAGKEYTEGYEVRVYVRKVENR